MCALAAALGDADAVFLMSHGIAFVGTNIRECTLVGIYLESAVSAQFTIAMTGLPLPLARPSRRAREARANAHRGRHRQLLGLLHAPRRGYAGGFSAYGLISARASNVFAIALYLPPR